MAKKRRWSLISAAFAAGLALFAILWNSFLDATPLYTEDGRVFYTPKAQRALFRDHTAEFDALRDTVAGCETGFLVYEQARGSEWELEWHGLDRAARPAADYPPEIVRAVTAFWEAYHCSVVVWRPADGRLEVQFYATNRSRQRLHDDDGFVYFFQPPAEDQLWNLQDMGGGWYWFEWPVR